MDESGPILLRLEGGVLSITLNRAEKRNAIDAHMRKSLLEALEKASGDSGVRAVLLAGRGEHFCAGGDVGQMGVQPSSLHARERMLFVQRITSTLLGMEKPVVAAVDGVAFGGGFSMMLAADLALGTPRTRLCASFARLGLIPDMQCLYLLPRLVGLARARQIVMTGRIIDAEEAVQAGLLYELTEPSELMARAMEAAQRFARGPTEALGLTRNLLVRSFSLDEATLRELEALTQSAMLTSDFHREAARRFLAREPQLFDWPGR